MAKWLGSTLWDRAQGKWHVTRICEKVFNDYSESDATGRKVLKVENFHVAVLMVYNSVNKQLLSPHKEPPSRETVEAKKIRDNKVESLNLEQFQSLIMEWLRKDLNIVLVNRGILAFLAAPALAMATKRATKEIPNIGKAVQKVPTPVLFSLFSVGLVLLQDLRVG